MGVTVGACHPSPRLLPLLLTLVSTLWCSFGEDVLSSSLNVMHVHEACLRLADSLAHRRISRQQESR
jgi:hypothetical protein